MKSVLMKVKKKRAEVNKGVLVELKSVPALHLSLCLFSLFVLPDFCAGSRVSISLGSMSMPSFSLPYVICLWNATQKKVIKGHRLK